MAGVIFRLVPGIICQVASAVILGYQIQQGAWRAGLFWGGLAAFAGILMLLVACYFANASGLVAAAVICLVMVPIASMGVGLRQTVIGIIAAVAWVVLAMWRLVHAMRANQDDPRRAR